jgi:starch phosphorylase
VTGWAVGRDGEVAGDHAGHLYEQLENAVLPLLQGDAARRVWMMKQAISRISGASTVSA